MCSPSMCVHVQACMHTHTNCLECVRETDTIHRLLLVVTTFLGHILIISPFCPI